jgi:hypothetical protein
MGTRVLASTLAAATHGTCRMCDFQPFDALLQKKINISERLGLTLRFESLNSLNIVVFGVRTSV